MARARIPRDVFAALERAEPLLMAALGPRGVVRVEWVVGFVEPYRISVWLGTKTDQERDALGPEPFLDEVKRLVASAGLPQERAWVSVTVAQSEETVGRDHQGSWFYALR